MKQPEQKLSKLETNEVNTRKISENEIFKRMTHPVFISEDKVHGGVLWLQDKLETQHTFFFFFFTS